MGSCVVCDVRVHQVPLGAFFPTGQNGDTKPDVSGSQIEVPLYGNLGERFPVSVTTTAGPVETRQMLSGKQKLCQDKASFLLPTSTYRTGLTVGRV